MVPLAFARGLLTPPGKSDDPGVSRSTPPVLHGYQTTPLHGAQAKLSSRLTREEALKLGEPSFAWPIC